MDTGKAGKLDSLQALTKSEVGRLVEARIKEFKQAGGKPLNEIFKELCFCILTANYNAEKAIVIQKRVEDGFLTLPEGQLAGKLRKLGYRYPNARAGYILDAREKISPIGNALKTLQGDELRDWLTANIKGLGLKESSHFLRNIGYKDYAIIDYHILDLLEKEKLITRPKTLNRKKYLEIEVLLRKLGRKLKLSLAELDLYLWYLETGKILK